MLGQQSKKNLRREYKEGYLIPQLASVAYKSKLSVYKETKQQYDVLFTGVQEVKQSNIDEKITLIVLDAATL